MAVLLNQIVLEQRGPWRRLRSWWQGVHPERGMISCGWSGLETVEEKEYFKPTHVIAVSMPARTDPRQAA